MHCHRCQHENTPRMKFCGECGTPLTVNPSGPPAPSYAEITSALSEALEQQTATAELQQPRARELAESLEQQTATAEILQVIASSPTNLQPVLDAVVQNAARVCGADDVVLARLDGDVLRFAAGVGPVPKLAPGERAPSSRGSVAGRAVVDRRTVHIHDLEAEPEAEFSEAKARQRLVGFRTVLATPLLREGIPIGAFVVRRMQVRPFTEKQIKLLETFADQAVIAIENVRLFTELRGAEHRD